MPYIGNTSPSRFVSNRAASVYSGDGSTTAFTLEQAVVQDEDILVSVDGVVQEPSVAYAVRMPRHLHLLRHLLVMQVIIYLCIT